MNQNNKWLTAYMAVVGIGLVLVGARGEETRRQITNKYEINVPKLQAPVKQPARVKTLPRRVKPKRVKPRSPHAQRQTTPTIFHAPQVPRYISAPRAAPNPRARPRRRVPARAPQQRVVPAPPLPQAAPPAQPALVPGTKTCVIEDLCVSTPAVLP